MTLEELRKLTEAINGFPSGNAELEHDELLRALGLEPGKVYHELEMTSRFADIRLEVSFTSSDISLHSHSFYEIICCNGGRNVEMLVDSERYRIEPGDIIFIPPGVSHRPILPEEMPEPYRRHVLWLSEEFVTEFQQFFPASAHDLLQESRLVRTSGTQWEYLTAFFVRLLKEDSVRGLGWEALLVSNAIQFLVMFFRAVSERTTLPMKAEKPELLDRVISYIESNLHKHISLSETAQLFFVSESTISQTFRNKLGISFYRYVTQRRLISAKNLIAQDMSLESIAEQVGFSDYSSFYRAFKQEYGISPRQYRNSQT